MLPEYKNKYNLKIGYLPTRRNAFDYSEAARNATMIEQKIKGYNIQIVSIDFLNAEGLIYSGLDAGRVAEYFLMEKVDAIFAPHCNFGTEDAVAKVAKRVGCPLLLWGPLDDAPLPDGSRLRDTQCGLFATSKVLSRFGVPFTYITNSRLEDDVFDRGFRNFLSAVSVVKTFKNLRIGQIDTRPGSFWSVMCNEGELLERFGIETVPVTLVDLEKWIKDIIRENGEEYRSIMDSIRTRFASYIIDADILHNISALKLAIQRWALSEGLSAVGIQCWTSIQSQLGIYPCFINGELSDDGLPVACETDIHGAVSVALLQSALRGSTPSFLADLTVRHPHNPNAELLWHCGNFPLSLAKNPSKARLENHFAGNCPAAGRWEIRGGDVTLCRFDGMNGEYRLLTGHGRGIEGPVNNGTYLWVEFKDWPKWEHRFIYGPYIHHVAGIHGKAAPALYEACRYIPGLECDPVEPTREEIEIFLRG